MASPHRPSLPDQRLSIVPAKIEDLPNLFSLKLSNTIYLFYLDLRLIKKGYFHNVWIFLLKIRNMSMFYGEFSGPFICAVVHA